MRSRFRQLRAAENGGLATLFAQVEAVSEHLGAAELLELIGQTGRIRAILEARYAAASAPPAPSAALPDEAERYLDAAGAAAYLSVSKSTVVRLAKAGTIPARYPSPGTVRFDRRDLDAHVARARRQE